ncbi:MULTISPECIES: dihydrolipoyl dehydrogenase [Brevibacillus]|uniref:dihydrolipoyl dehydrogenase n=1 Tax=Brevibacillus TaxID=55080 RepID=UPI0004F370CD|nr:dihydrolipoyl dehydrogenase [Brevibacillus borstelensis]KKX56881.1 dihydrolipoamide dehydrogenase [Brevibacillus borstelensis cifa_chp40]MCM3589493.1 dihydrolipoyl dehydrogenase [Brevibacillus borstelensis]MED1851146.1 dihydrolipoyl dehydrogenase [Brevibacillus borstelensis]MED2010804.1 dihydrolipoyl dehydrogenase [Brevibacillus borstelensis]
MSQEYDLVVLGGGTGGYVAAIRASQLGMKVAVVEKGKMGGTCLHRGCIPSKALLRSAEVFATLKEGDKYGVTAEKIGLDFARVQARKEGIVEQLHKGIQYLMKKGNITVIEGFGRVMGPSIFSPQAGAVRIETPSGEQEMLVPRFLLLATGSRPRTLPGLTIDGKQVVTSDEALQWEQLPSSVVIVGGGVIGIEWASMLNDFGVEVTVVEYADRILPTEDEEISKEMARLLKKRKINIVTGARVLPESLETSEGKVAIQAETAGGVQSFSAEKLLVSVGRQANVENIGLEATEIRVENGFISVNEYFQTAESHIYAIGDVIGGLQLAHVASHEGILAVEHMAGLAVEPLDYTKVPKCTYGRPEVANVGLTEAEARSQGFDVKVGKFSFKPLGKALVHGENDGFVKIIADAKTNDLLGVHMIGPHVTDMISEAGLARVLDATPWEIGHTIHPHPTLSEAIMEAALAVDGKAIHS